MLTEVIPLRHASREIIRELGFLEDHLEPSGVTHSQCHALIEIEARGSITQAELAAVLRLHKSRTSRVVDDLVHRGWASRAHGSDGRTRIVSLTKQGNRAIAGIHVDANARVERALALLDPPARASVLAGMSLYARALERSRRRAAYVVRPIQKSDAPGVAALIRTVMPEFGASGPGFAIMDPEVDDMHAAYASHGRRAAYYVIVRADNGAVVGGGGFAALFGGDKKTTELRKMYLLRELRGLGFGRELLSKCMAAAAAGGYTRMYLETLAAMKDARALYEENEFIRIAGPIGKTGHYGCDAFYKRDL